MGKRQREPEIFEDDDGENVDPAAFSSPTKKPRSSSHVYAKPARPAMLASPARSNAALTASPAASMPSIRKALSSPNTAKSTPISHSRGSPKNKRLHAVAKRRASSSPFRRVDPPSFSQGALPFSIDAALSGTLSTYTPKPATAAPPPASTLADSMPASWFFAIHEDTPEQEAANLMEHSASVLDISSDDDAHTKARTVDALRGKENIPPLDFVRPRPADDETDVEDAPKHARRARRALDAMDEDRRPLGDLPPSEFYADGCDAGSFVTVDGGIGRPSGLSREVGREEADEDENGVSRGVVRDEGQSVVVGSEARDLSTGSAHTPEVTIAAPTPEDSIAAQTLPTLPAEPATTPPPPSSQPHSPPDSART